MTKNILFSNKMLVLLQTYTKKGETHTYPLAFPPFWAYSMSCFEAILFRHSGFPGTASVLLGTLSLPFWGQPDPGRFIRRRKAGIFPPAYASLGQMAQNPSASGGLCPLDKGRTRVLYRLFSFPCMGQKNPGHPLRAFTRKRPFTPAAAAPAGRAGALAAKWRCDPLPRRPALSPGRLPAVKAPWCDTTARSRGRASPRRP